MNVFSSYKPENKVSAKSWDAIVIGSGMGGIACAAALAKAGQRVLVLEQHYNAGGFAHTFSRKGYTWDVGVHCVGEMGPRNMPGKILSWLSDGKIEMAPIGKTYDTAFFPDGTVIEYPDSWREFKKKLEDDFPAEKQAIQAYFDLIWKVSKTARPYLLLRTLPAMLRKVGLRAFHLKTGYWTRTTNEVLDELTDNARLKAVLTAQWGAYGITPNRSCFALHALVIRHFWNGGYFPSGGSQNMVNQLLKTVQDGGGETLVRASVEEILLKRGKAVGVRLAGGEEIFAPIVVSAAGAKATIQKLLPEKLKKSAWATEILDIPQSPGCICLNLGLKGDVLKAGATSSNQWLFESWNMDSPESWDINDPNSVAPALYVSFSSLKDPKHDPGPEQRHTAEVITFVPWGAFAKWQHTRRGKRDPDYIAFKKDIETRLLAQLKRHLPKLVELIDYHELSTPLSINFFTRAPQGAIYGLEATPKRFTSHRLGTRTPVKNLYLAGGDVAILGVTGAMIGGMLAACTIKPRLFKQLL
ncbi:MAG: NAD(P)/FAD-dependent oxidoreductase [Deltaproteobacteria bacterium]|nr:NAD(P)/FAD-dependent oxidoreductase [Deltaproteobacteria bacterium]